MRRRGLCSAPVFSVIKQWDERSQSSPDLDVLVPFFNHMYEVWRCGEGGCGGSLGEAGMHCLFQFELVCVCMACDAAFLLALDRASWFLCFIMGCIIDIGHSWSVMNPCLPGVYIYTSHVSGHSGLSMEAEEREGIDEGSSAGECIHGMLCCICANLGYQAVHWGATDSWAMFPPMHTWMNIVRVHNLVCTVAGLQG